MNGLVAHGTVLSFQNADGVLEFRVLDKLDPLLDTASRFCETCERVREHVDFGDNTDTCKECKEANDLQVELLNANSRKRGRLSQDDPERKVQGYKRFAEGRGFTWELSDEQATMLFQQICVYCGKKPVDGSGNGINRVDNSIRGYVLSNSVTACAICNFIKLDYSVEDFVKICKTIASHRGLIAEKVSYLDVFRNSPTPKSYRQYANGTHRVMALDKPTFDVLLLGDCFYCGKPNDPPHHFNGIDRIDSKNRKYELGNVLTCCKTCNTLKWSFTQEEFFHHVRNVAEYYDFSDPKKHPPKTWTRGRSKEEPIEL